MDGSLIGKGEPMYWGIHAGLPVQKEMDCEGT